MILHQITVLPHLETLVQNCSSCEQTPEHTTERGYRCAHDKETHVVAGKLTVLQIWRDQMQEEHRRPHDADNNDAVNRRSLKV
jgi:hypothetical protein